MDYAYLAQSLANMSAIPVRLYRGEQLIGSYRSGSFQPDPVLSCLEEILRGSGSVSYHMTPEYLIYGLVRVKGSSLAMVAGPVAPTPLDAPAAWAILAAMGQPPSRAGELLEYLGEIPGYPLRNFLQILCTMAYALNAEKLTVADLLLDEEPAPLPLPEGQEPAGALGHNSYALERELLSYVEQGQPQALETLFQRPVTGRVGYMARNALRQQKNLLVSTATLVSRSAIRGGLAPETALDLADRYIRQGESLASCEELIRLNVRMTLDFARQVEALGAGIGAGRLQLAAARYIRSHLSERLSTAEVAAALGKNRSYLCTRFREETGLSLNAYITRLRMEEARRLLRATDKPLKEIADQLGFSSQSYFQKVFKAETGLTPGAYRASPEHPIQSVVQSRWQTVGEGFNPPEA